MYFFWITRFFSALFLLVALASWSLSCWAAEWRRWRLSGILLTLSSVPLRTGVPQSCFVYQPFNLAGPVPFLRVWVLTWKIRWCPLWANCIASADVSLEHFCLELPERKRVLSVRLTYLNHVPGLSAVHPHLPHQTRISLCSAATEEVTGFKYRIFWWVLKACAWSCLFFKIWHRFYLYQ